MESKDISYLSSSGFKRRWKVLWAMHTQQQTMHKNAVEPCMARGPAAAAGFLPALSASWLGCSLFFWHCLISNQCCCSMGLHCLGCTGLFQKSEFICCVRLFSPSYRIILCCPQSKEGTSSAVSPVFVAWWNCCQNQQVGPDSCVGGWGVPPSL